MSDTRTAPATKDPALADALANLKAALEERAARRAPPEPKKPVRAPADRTSAAYSHPED